MILCRFLRILVLLFMLLDAGAAEIYKIYGFRERSEQEKKRETVCRSLFGVGGGVRTHDLQIHNLAL